MAWNGEQPPIIVPPRAPLPARPSRMAAVQAVTRRPTVVKPKQESILTVSELERFKNLMVFAQTTVEGFFSGKHRSPYRGSSAEFADYKEYVHGDDVAHLDWRVYGRLHRLFVRQYEEETDMVVYLLVDASASMNYAGAGRQSKFHLAAKIAAALAYLMMAQGDKSSLALFADKVKQFVPPGGTRRHLNRLVTELELVKPALTTGIARALSECNPIFKKRGKLVLLSDFMTDRQETLEALGQYLHRKFEVLLLHVVDPDELNLPPINVARFVDMETQEQVQVEPEEIRQAYQEHVRENIESLAREADQLQMSHSLVNTANPYLDALEAYLGFRGKRALNR